jgi:DNA-binding winged helix-turn-helix (wHTH) protein/TolB-like protein/Tfp pilus assembly protein PilF
VSSSKPQLENRKTEYCFGAFRLDLNAGLLRRDGIVVDLRPKSFEVLAYLLDRAGRLVSKDELVQAVWHDVAVTDNSLSQCMVEIRRVLGDDSQEIIRTVARRGYLFAASVSIDQQVQPAPAAAEPPTVAVQAPPPHRLKWVLAAATALLVAGLALWLGSRPSPPVADTLAVLPFKMLVPEDQDEYLGAGVTDSLITRLSLVRGLSIRPWVSVQLYREASKDPVVAGRELHVQTVLDGTIQKSGGQIRLTSRLYRVADGKVLWAGTFDESYNNMFGIEDSISEKVAAALSVKLGRPRQPVISPEAYDVYVRGYHFFEQFTRDGNQKAFDYLEKALRIQPDFALAHAYFALNLGVMRVRGFISPRENFDRQKEAAERALALDDSLPEANLANAVLAMNGYDWPTTERFMRRSIELNPNYLDGWGFYSFLLEALGRHDEALAASRREVEIDPVSDYGSKDLATALIWSRQYPEAIAQAKKALELRPDFGPAHDVLAMAYFGANQFDEAYQQFVIAGDRISAAHVRAAQGDLAPARKLRNDLEHVQSNDKALAMALVYVTLGEKDRAFDALESAYNEKIPILMYLAVHPWFAPLHGDPRFNNLVARMRLSTSS